MALKTGKRRDSTAKSGKKKEKEELIVKVENNLRAIQSSATQITMNKHE